MKKLLLLLTLSLISYTARGMLPQHISDKQEVLSKLPGKAAGQNTVDKVHELLITLNHPNPNSVAVRIAKREHRGGYYIPSKNLIFLNSAKAKFTMAHEAAHAVHETNANVDDRLLSMVLSLSSQRFFYTLFSNVPKNITTTIMKKTLANPLSAAIIIPWAVLNKFVSQPRELRADIEGTEALLKLGNNRAVEKWLQILSTEAERTGMGQLDNESITDKILRYLEQDSGFYFDQNKNQEHTIDYSRGTSERFWNNWSTHPTNGKRYFTAKALLDDYNKKMIEQTKLAKKAGKTTEFVLGFLNKAEWCKTDSTWFGSRTVCDSSLKNAVLDPHDKSEGRYFVDTNDESKNISSLSSIELDKFSKKEDSSLRLDTYIDVHDKGAIKRFKKQNEINAEPNVLSKVIHREWPPYIAKDKYTTCYGSFNEGSFIFGTKPTLMCNCITNIPYDEFLKRMKQHNN